MKLRKFDADDFLEVVQMFKEFTKELYPHRKIGSDMAFSEVVLNWIKLQKHIFVTVNEDNSVTGFSMSELNHNDYITEPTYQGNIAYVKPNYRGGKSAYLLYNNMVQISKDLGLNISANAFINQYKIDKIQKKFGGNMMYINMETRR